MTVDTAAALQELHDPFAKNEEIINGSTELKVSGTMTRLMLTEQLIYRTGSLRATTISPVGIRGKEEANDFKPNVYRGDKNGETFTAFRMELLNWAGAVHDSMLQVLETAEAEEGRIAEANVRNRGLNQETVDDFKEMDRQLYQLLLVRRK